MHILFKKCLFGTTMCTIFFFIIIYKVIDTSIHDTMLLQIVYNLTNSNNNDQGLLYYIKIQSPLSIRKRGAMTLMLIIISMGKQKVQNNKIKKHDNIFTQKNVILK